jgi:cold shock CspA family protein
MSGDGSTSGQHGTDSECGTTPAPLQTGTICRLEPQAGFGYVRDATGTNQYIFVFGKAIRFSEARTLRLGSAVRFRVETGARVTEVHPV